MDLEKLRADYAELTKEFGEDGAPVVAGITKDKLKAALESETNYTKALRDFIDSRALGYEGYSTEYKIQLLELEHFIAESGSAANAAKKLGKTGSTISNIRKCCYKGVVAGFFNDFKSYIETQKERAEFHKNSDYVPTSVSQTIYEAIRHCHIVGDCEIITGDTGIGKTCTIKKYISDNPEHAILITPTRAENSVSGVMRLIAKQLGINCSNRIAELQELVLSKLHDGMIIIVDEAQKLSFPAIDHLRAIADVFIENDETLGVCFVGNPSFNRLFDEKKLPVTGQVWNRSDLRPEIRSEDIKLDDIKMLFPKLLEEKKIAEIKFLFSIAQTNGEGIRRAVKFYESAYSENKGVVTLEKIASFAQNGHARIPNIGVIIRKLREESNEQ